MDESLVRARLDAGRLIMVPAFAVAVVADVFSLEHGAHGGAAGVLWSVGAVFAVAFYALAIWCYIRRRPAVATSGSMTAHAAAIIATWQIYRAVREEQVLLQACPAYRSYRSRTAALLPGVFWERMPRVVYRWF